jgi:hypothetical protein
MSENPLSSELELSVHAQGYSEALKHLKACHSIIEASGKPHTLIDSRVTKLLSKLTSKYSSQVFLPVSKLYLVIVKHAGKCSANILIKVCNDILMLREELKGSDIAQELTSNVESLLKILSKTELDESQTEVLSTLLLKKNDIDIDIKINDIILLLQENNILGIHYLFDLFSNFDSFSTQIEVFTKNLSPVINAIQNLNNIEIVNKLLDFLEHFIFRFNYSVQLGEFNEIYTVTHISKLSPSILPIVLEIINTILVYDVTIVQKLIPIFHRIWILFSHHTESFYDSIRLTLSAIGSQGSAEYKSKASIFLYEVMSTISFPQKCKDSLESEENIKLLMQDPAFNPSSIVLESENPIKLESLQPVVGLPLNIYIPAGEEYYYCVEITEANSIIAWGFATEYYDVDFELMRIDLPSPQVVLKQQKVKCDKSPSTGSKLVSSPGLYKFVWTNKYSWFTSKHIRFRISVLTPYHKALNTEKDLHKVIEIITDDNVSFNSKDILEVGIVCSSKNILISSRGLTEEIPDLDSLAIQGFISKIKKDKKFSSVKIGIVAKMPKKRNEIKQLGAVAMCRDVDAIALLNQSEIHCETMICVMQEDGVRSCVVSKGKVMVDGNGSPIGDLFRAGVNDVFIGISVLLSLFGPATVVLTGADAPAVSEVINRIKDLVPETIIQQSSIRLSVFGPQVTMIAASRLHYLSHKFRINS